MIIQRIKSLR